MKWEDIQKQVIKQALDMGFSDCEMHYDKTEVFEVMVMEGEVNNYENSSTQGIAFRGNFENRTGYAYTEQLTEEGLADLLCTAKENAELLCETQKETLYPPELKYPTLQCENQMLERLTPEEKILATKKMETAAMHTKLPIASVDYCLLGTYRNQTAIANSLGLSLSFCRNGAMAYVSTIAKNGDEVKTGSDFWKGNDWKTFDPSQTGKCAAERAASHLGAKTIQSGKYDVVLDKAVMTSFLGIYSGVFYAEQVQKGFSLLKDKVGQKIATDCVTLYDNPLLENGYASTPFDSEGVACYDKAVIQNGILQTYLYNRKAAEKDGVSSTGNGFKAGLQAPVKTAATNFYIEKGTKPQEMLLQDMQNGLLITDISGLHAGANTISGDFSLLAEGFCIENGKKTYPVEQITIAGNFYKLLKEIKEVGSDLFFAQSGKGSPSVRVTKMDIAGE